MRYLMAIRIEKGLSIHDMAVALNKTNREYISMENGCIDKVTIGDCKNMIKKLNMNPLELIGLMADPGTDPL
jgi:hypothetical protein